MRFQGFSGEFLRIGGRFEFSAASEFGKVTDKFQIEIRVRTPIGIEPPEIWEVGGRIPREGEFHINPDGSICLGSRARRAILFRNNASLNVYAEEFLVPYLYCVSRKLRNAGGFEFGELKHGPKGLCEDYAELLHLENCSQVKLALQRLGSKKRISNKMVCPCGCGRALRQCRFHNRLNEVRVLLPRSEWKRIAAEIGKV